jgi:CRP-like cAMP-binding protein
VPADGRSTSFDTDRAFLGSLPPIEREGLLASGRRRRWEKGEMLARTGARADSAVVLLAGLVKIHRQNPEGAEAVLGISGPGDLLGEIALVPDAVRSADATALEPVEGISLPASALRVFLAEHPAASLTLLQLSLFRLHQADARRLEFATAGSLARVASRILELAERFGIPRSDGSIDVGLPINQEELASWSAASRESTSRALRTLRSLGLIETTRLRLLVRDLDGLRGHAPRL